MRNFIEIEDIYKKEANQNLFFFPKTYSIDADLMAHMDNAISAINDGSFAILELDIARIVKKLPYIFVGNCKFGISFVLFDGKGEGIFNVCDVNLHEVVDEFQSSKKAVISDTNL